MKPLLIILLFVFAFTGIEESNGQGMAILGRPGANKNQPRFDKRIAPYTGFSANYSLDDREVELLSIALEIVANEIEKDKLQNLTRVTLIISKYGEVNMVMDDNALGTHGAYIVYPVQKMRDCKLSVRLILAVFVEELVHHFWREERESEAKKKTIEIMKQSYEDLKFEDIYTENLGLKISSFKSE